MHFFFLGYVLMVGTAVLQVIYGVFLNVTFACANSDDETLMAKKNREMKRYAQKMQALFVELDITHDGFLTREEFRVISQNEKIQHYLAAMDFEIRDVEVVYDLLGDGQERLSAPEMVYGFSRLKGNARSIDVMALISMTRNSITKLETKLDLFLQHQLKSRRCPK